MTNRVFKTSFLPSSQLCLHLFFTTFFVIALGFVGFFSAFFFAGAVPAAGELGYTQWVTEADDVKMLENFIRDANKVFGENTHKKQCVALNTPTPSALAPA